MSVKLYFLILDIEHRTDCVVSKLSKCPVVDRNSIHGFENIPRRFSQKKVKKISIS